MKKSDLKKILPPSLTRVYYTMVIWKYRFTKNKYVYRDKVFNGKSVIVMANGPSLNEEILKNRECFVNNECIACNLAVGTDYFFDIKPKNYIIVDPIFFVIDGKRMGESVKKIIDGFSKVDWDMGLFVPETQRESEFVNRISSNPHIKLRYLCGAGIDFEYFSKRLLNKYLGEGKCSPPGAMVTCSAIYVALLCGAKEVYVVGMDCSYIPTVAVDQITNEVYFDNSHFYSEKKSRKMYNGDMEQLLKGFASDLSDLKIVNDFAQSLGVMVYNSSMNSWVDVLPRKNLNGIMN